MNNNELYFPNSFNSTKELAYKCLPTEKMTAPEPEEVCYENSCISYRGKQNRAKSGNLC